MEKIIAALQEKAVLKQRMYHQTREVFEGYRKMVMGYADTLHTQMKGTTPEVPVSFHETGELEFRFRFSGDFLIFNMHSNIMALPPDHPALRTDYLREDPCKAFFGQILIYNFMHDSFKYNRQQDIGYMVARLMINCDRRFFIEGVRPLNFIQPDISTEPLTDAILHELMEKAMLVAIETDLTSVPMQSMLVMSVGDKIAQNESRAGEKLGFRFSGE
jgi:hypothetical protein